MSQRNAVFAAFVSVFRDSGVDFEAGMDANKLVTEQVRGAVHAIICEGFRKGTIELADTPSNREKLANEAEMNKYVSGLLSNWLRKDPNLNGGGKYVPKNPGSRTGQSDKTIQTLKAYAKAHPDQASKVSTLIEKRKAEIAASKAKTVELTQEQLDALPADIRAALDLE